MTRTTIALIAVAAVLAVQVLLIAPLEGKREQIKEELFVKHKALVKYERFIASGAGAQKQLETLRNELSGLEKKTLNEKDTSLAYASLQSMLQDMADRAGLKVNSVKPLENVDHEGYSEMPLLLDCSGAMGALSTFLKRLDRSGSLVSLEKIRITTAPRRGLRIKMQLTGIMQRPAGSRGK